MKKISSLNARHVHDFLDGKGLVPAHRHVNGGGWVADSASVDASAYVGRQARVFGNAAVSESAKICDFAEVCGYARVLGNAVIAGRAKVQGRALIDGDARVDDDSFVSTNIHIGNNIRLNDHATLVDLRSCLSCPFMPVDSYGMKRENPCVNCLTNITEREKTLRDQDSLQGKSYRKSWRFEKLLASYRAAARGTRHAPDAV